MVGTRYSFQYNNVIGDLLALTIPRHTAINITVTYLEM